MKPETPWSTTDELVIVLASSATAAIVGANVMGVYKGATADRKDAIFVVLVVVILGVVAVACLTRWRQSPNTAVPA